MTVNENTIKRKLFFLAIQIKKQKRYSMARSCKLKRRLSYLLYDHMKSHDKVREFDEPSIILTEIERYLRKFPTFMSILAS